MKFIIEYSICGAIEVDAASEEEVRSNIDNNIYDVDVDLDMQCRDIEFDVVCKE